MEQQPKKASRVFLKVLLLIFIPLAVAGGIVYAIPRYYYDVTDSLKLLNYEPPEDISNLAAEASFSPKARQIFYVHQPEINGKTDFNKNCPIPELTFVLGCYTGANIYLLDIEKAELEAAESVTAAHEMLHAAYTRLPIKEKQRVDQLLRTEFENTDDKRLIDLIAKYEAHDSTSIPTELHSIIGTEVSELSPELESYYGQYFTDRSKIVADFEGYEKVFSSLEKRIDSIQNSLDNIKSEIDELETTIDKQLDDIDSINAELKNLEASNKISQYNALVPEQNQLVNSYNANIRKYQSLTKSYNSKVNEVNEISVRHNDLLNSVNSKYQEINE